MVNYNKSFIEPYSDLIDAGFLNYRSNITPSSFPFSQQENEHVENQFHETELNEQTEIGCSDETQSSLNYSEASSHFLTPILSVNEVNSKIRSLNLKQRQIFDFIHDWAKLNVKVKSGTTKKQSPPFHLFLLGSGGCGQSHLIQTIFHSVSKVFLYRTGDPTKPRVLLLAPTSVAATINDNTNNNTPTLCRREDSNYVSQTKKRHYL